MNNKNGLKVAHWILISITAVTLAIGVVICILSKVEFDKLLPIMISALTLLATIVLDGIGSKKQKKTRAKNIVKDSESGGAMNVGEKNADDNRDVTNSVTGSIAKGDINVGNEYN